MDIKEIWQIFKVSSAYDKDMQAVFRRHATPNACIELLEENEKLCAENETLKKDLQFFIDQSVIIEHKQDHETMRKLREKYGFEY